MVLNEVSIQENHLLPEKLVLLVTDAVVLHLVTCPMAIIPIEDEERIKTEPDVRQSGRTSNDLSL